MITQLRALSSKKLSAWEVVDVLHDVWTVSSSLVDIVTDILVAREFYNKEHFTFFYLSVTIFIAAQLSYAFLFVGTWAQGKTSLGKICVFFCVLPFGQLIPIFAWIESFRFTLIDNILKKFSLTPTGISQDVLVTNVLDTLPVILSDDDSDSLWTYIQKKYTAHAGFLAEAFVEAIPQGILQTVAILILDDTSPLNIFSILMSITVVASKGYLVSYSIHKPSFIFNYLTIAADSFALFSSVTWLWIRIENVSDNPIIRHPWLCLPALIGMSCCAYGGFFLLSFTMLDDHLKSKYPYIYKEFVDTPIWFDVYLVRFIGWILAILPTSVVYLSAKFSLLPVVFFGSLDPEHAVHSRFYKPLFRFLDGHIGKERYLTRLPDIAQNKKLNNNNNNNNNNDDENEEDKDHEEGNYCHQVFKKIVGYMLYRTPDREEETSIQRISSTSIALEFKHRDDINKKKRSRVDNNNHHHRHESSSKFGSLDRQIRLQVTNRFLHQSKIKQSILEKALLSPPRMPLYGEPALTLAENAKLIFNKWMKTLDITEPTRSNIKDQSSNEEDNQGGASSTGEDEDMLALLLLEASRLRQENIRVMAEDAIGESASHLKSRSEILRHFISRKTTNDNNDDKEDASSGCSGLLTHLYTDIELFLNVDDGRWLFLRNKIRDPPSFSGKLCMCNKKVIMNIKKRLYCLIRFFLRIGGLFALLNITIAVMVLIPSTLIFMIYSAVFPLTQMHYCAAAGHDDDTSSSTLNQDDVLLPCILSSSYAICLFGLIILTPFVSRFQLLRTDLRNAKNFPEQFYSKETAKDIYLRYVAAQSRIEVSRHILTRVGRYNAMEVLSYLDEANHNLAYV